MSTCYLPPPGAFRTLVDAYDYEGEKVGMGPRRCSYSKENDYNQIEKTVILGEEIPRKKNSNGSSHTPIPVELRGITLRQLRSINANIIDRCEKEEWINHEGEPLTPETVSLYDVNKYVVLPFTKDSQSSFVEVLPSTCGTQDPRFFLSHWWGEPFVLTLACLEQFVSDFKDNFNDSDDARGGGMTIDTPIWICIFANNQWKLDEAISIDPKHSSFTKALTGTAENRVISILDAEGKVFTRIWCDFELHLTFTARTNEGDVNRGQWAVYTAHEHKFFEEDRFAVGIISGGEIGETAFHSSLREKHFPTELILKSRNIKVESAEASMESDRVHILNSIAETKDFGAEPPQTHPNYDKVNDAVKGAFAASFPALGAALVAGEDEWKDILVRLSKGVMTGTFGLNFDIFLSFSHKLSRLSSSQARELISHIPVTCNGLDISKAKGDDGEGAIEGMIEWVGKAETIKILRCSHCKVGDWYGAQRPLEQKRKKEKKTLFHFFKKKAGQKKALPEDNTDTLPENNTDAGKDSGIRLADGLSKHSKTIEELFIARTDLIVSGNVSEWASALKKLTALKRLEMYGPDISDEEMSILENATHASHVIMEK